MIRKAIAITTVLALALVLLAGCAKHELGGEIETERILNITAENSAEGDFFTTGTLVVEEDNKIVIDSALEEDGAIDIALIKADLGEDATADEIAEAADPEKAVATLHAVGTDKTKENVPAGEYYVSVTTVKKATGTVTVTVKSNVER